MSDRAIKEGKADVAVQHYNATLAADLPGSAAFAAVLYANRAAAHQSLGQCTLAVADCLRATALNPTYSKVLPTCSSHCFHAPPLPWKTTLHSIELNHCRPLSWISVGAVDMHMTGIL